MEAQKIRDKFNQTLGVLLEHFSDRPFDRTTDLTLSEVVSRDLQTEASPVYFRSTGKVNISYCPSQSSYGNDEPTIHVRVYDPNESHMVDQLLKNLGLTPKITDNDPYSKVDIDATLN